MTPPNSATSTHVDNNMSHTLRTPQNHANDDSEQNQSISLGRVERIKQYQPSHRLVKVLLVWWLIVTFLSALYISNGFTIDGLTAFSRSVKDWLFMVAGLSLVVIAVIALIDLFCLISLSQPSRFSLSRQYPNNVPILHQLDIDAYLSVNMHNEGHAFDTFVNKSLATETIKSIAIDFYDDFPDNLALIEPNTSAVEVDTDVDKIGYHAMPIKAVIDTHLDSNQNNDSDQNNDSPDDSHGNSHGQKMLKISYPVIAIERGTGYFGAASLRVWSPLKLFRRQFKLSSPQTTNTDGRYEEDKYLRVLADFSGLLSNQLSAVFEHSISLGMQSILKQGHGSDFLKLREYTPGDAIRQIDWKATSRQRRLMSKSYEDDNDQDVVFLLDCGEQMRHHDTNPKHQIVDNRISDEPASIVHGDIEGLISSKVSQQLNLQTSYFDKVLNAMLLLSYVANKQSDRVGLMTFAGDEVYLPPKKGASLIRNLLNETADLKPSMQTSDYVTAAQKLLKRLNKRSLVVVITNTRAEATDELTQALKLLSKRHQVVFANLTEQVVHDHLHGNMPPENFDDSLLYHALNSYQQGRTRLHKKLAQQTGALCLQTTANKLPMKLTQAYLSLKGR